jgi:adenosylcobinamide kinase/adenosylcobinamide-phosphate guanylyltransferase
LSEEREKSANIFVLGGARSGKSAYALDLANSFPKDKLFIATAEALDDEMRVRIEKHKAARGVGWTTIEEPTEIIEAIAKNKEAALILIDCMTLWISNLMERNLTDAEILKEVSWLIAAIKEVKGTVIIVSNELGHSLVPDNPLGRRFVDLAGSVNQLIAGGVDEVYFLTAGLPTQLK